MAPPTTVLMRLRIRKMRRDYFTKIGFAKIKEIPGDFQIIPRKKYIAGCGVPLVRFQDEIFFCRGNFIENASRATLSIRITLETVTKFSSDPISYLHFTNFSRINIDFFYFFSESVISRSTFWHYVQLVTSA